MRTSRIHVPCRATPAKNRGAAPTSQSGEALLSQLQGHPVNLVPVPVRLLLVDADNLAPTLIRALHDNGFEVTAVTSAAEALHTVTLSMPDVIVTDVALPGGDGFEICRLIRAQGVGTPLLFVTARGSTEDRLHGFRVGADDYVMKPFVLNELVARIRAVLRRANDTHGDRVLRCAGLELDDRAFRVTRNGIEIDLSPTEYKLLRYLLVNQGRVVSKSQILIHVWHHDLGSGANVATYIRYLRRKVDRRPPHLIQTVRGVGYTLRPDS
jgi:two-component system, OmpR family, response regulator